MVAVAIFSADPILRRSLEQLPRDDPAVTLVGIVDHSSGLPKLLNQNQVDVVLMDIPTGAQLNEWQGFHNNHVALMVLIDAAEAGDTFEALNAGAQAVLRRSTSRNEIVTAMGGHVWVSRPSARNPYDVARRNAPFRWFTCKWLRASTIDAPRTRSACCHGRWCLKQSDRPSVGYFVPHGEVSRRRYSCQAQCRQSNRSGGNTPFRQWHPVQIAIVVAVRTEAPALMRLGNAGGPAGLAALEQRRAANFATHPGKFHLGSLEPGIIQTKGRAVWL